MFTTEEAAQYLAEHDYKGYKGTPITAGAVKKMCYRGLFPNARKASGPGKGIWLIPKKEVERLTEPVAPACDPDPR